MSDKIAVGTMRHWSNDSQVELIFYTDGSVEWKSLYSEKEGYIIPEMFQPKEK
jgi:hypothetical protein